MLKIRFPLILTPTVEAIGNCAEEIYFGLLRARREGRRVIFLFPRDFGKFHFSKGGLGINRALTKLSYPQRVDLPPLTSSLAEILLTVCFAVFISANFIQSRVLPNRRPVFPTRPSLGRSHLWSDCYQSPGQLSVSHTLWEKEFDHRLPIVLRQPIFRRVDRLLSDMGLPENASFVCLHVREGGYYGGKEGRGKEIRNANVHNYVEAIRSLTDRGYWVVRLGDKTMKPLPELSRVIDYALSEHKSDEADIYLVAHCEFYVGHNSGPWDAANLFGKPIMMPKEVAPEI